MNRMIDSYGENQSLSPFVFDCDRIEEVKMKQYSPSEIEKILKEVGHRPGALFFFNQLLEHYNSTHLEHEDTYLTVTETYVLIYIISKPGITASELVWLTGKSKGYISQTVRKLRQLDYVVQKRDKTTPKFIALYATESGVAFRDQYVRLDEQDSSHILQSLLERCTKEEIASFYKVVGVYSDILRDILASDIPADALGKAKGSK